MAAEPLVNKTVRLSKEQIAALQEEGERDRRDLSALIRIAVDELLERRRPAQPAGAHSGEAVAA